MLSPLQIFPPVLRRNERAQIRSALDVARNMRFSSPVVIVGISDVRRLGLDLSRWSRQRQVKTVMQLVVSELEQPRTTL